MTVWHRTNGLRAHEDYSSLPGEVFTWYGKTVLGGPFGHGGFMVAYTLDSVRNMPTARYTVFHEESGLAFSEFKPTIAEALAVARKYLLEIEPPVLADILMQKAAERRRHKAAYDDKMREMHQRIEDSKVPKIRPISKKRQQIFEKSAGKCHYCEVVLEQDGGWHVEHMQPRSRGGNDHIDNLVAACAPCNQTKRTKTAEEFIAGRKGAEGG